MPRRIFQVSSDLFWGFREEIDMACFQQIEEIPAYIKRNMKRFFQQHHLLALAEKVDTLQLHIHCPVGCSTVEELYVRTGPSDIIYVCDHCGG